MDTGFSYVGGNTAFFSSDERKWINRIHKLKETHPDDIEILREPEVNDGCIYAKIPADWFKLRPAAKLSVEQREASRARMTAMNAQK